jgi:hypothetical protein
MIMYKMTASKQIYADSNLEINHPAKGNDTIEPMGRPIKILPKAASERDKACL